MQEAQVRSLGRKDALEKEMVTDSSILAWRIPWMEEPGRLQSSGSQRVGHNWATSLSLSYRLLISTPGRHKITYINTGSKGVWSGQSLVAKMPQECSNTKSVQFSCSLVSNSLGSQELQHARPPCPSPTPRIHTDSCSSSQWCHPAISSSVIPFSSCPQSLPASESFPMSQLFAWSGQSTGVSALALFLPKKSQGWSPSEWTGWIYLQSKGLSRVFSSTTVQKHQFFSTQPSSQSNSHIHTWPQEKP